MIFYKKYFSDHSTLKTLDKKIPKNDQFKDNFWLVKTAIVKKN
jgi:hypothetical protein